MADEKASKVKAECGVCGTHIGDYVTERGADLATVNHYRAKHPEIYARAAKP